MASFGVTKSIDVTPTITLDAYVAGDVVGGVLTFQVDTVGGGKILSLRIIDAADQKEPYYVYIFDALPTAVADADAFATGIAIADKIRIIKRVTVAASFYESIDGDAVAIRDGINVSFIGTNKLYAYAVAVETPDYAAVNDLTFVLTVETNP